jgi:tRNA (guanine37-N1)-methyltransferase
MNHWHVNILTLFPEMFPGTLGHSLGGKALEQGLWSYKAVNIRGFAADRHKTVDDTPFGGGAGMVMRADVIEKALLALSLGERKIGRKIYLSPRGKPLTQNLVKELAEEETLTLLCGRYEGVDQRVLDAYEFEEISVGDYVLSGGEPAAMILMDACIRLLPGVMGNEDTPSEESFSEGLLEYPHYTRPAEWTTADGRAFEVPEILRSGDHGKIAVWRREKSLELTNERRPDLLIRSQKGAKSQRLD